MNPREPHAFDLDETSPGRCIICGRPKSAYRHLDVATLRYVEREHEFAPDPHALSRCAVCGLYRGGSNWHVETPTEAKDASPLLRPEPGVNEVVRVGTHLWARLEDEATNSLYWFMVPQCAGDENERRHNWNALLHRADEQGVPVEATDMEVGYHLVPHLRRKS